MNKTELLKAAREAIAAPKRTVQVCILFEVEAPNLEHMGESFERGLEAMREIGSAEVFAVGARDGDLDQSPLREGKPTGRGRNR